MNPCAILIFAKEPRPGKVKTRMTPPWSPEEAAQLSLCFIRDTLEAVSKVSGVDCYLYFTPRESRPVFQGIVPETCTLVPQKGASFTERCAHSVADAFLRGYARIVQIGTDTPHIKAGFLEAAIALLSDHDMGFGPTRDGGYYVLSLNRPAVTLYEGVQMGGKEVFARMMANAVRLGLKVQRLEESIDADTHEDLLVLHENPCYVLGTHTRRFLKGRL
ncbi:MAG: TIGR04282 family arsenosugar biosynthesis glycosyltransferase [bacterium]|nr:TIGR04282 family arsenosugar biosynthesis glycosyltransferase [bacterium]